MKQYIIWTNRCINVSDWEDYLNENYPDVTDGDEIFRLIQEGNNFLLDDERLNLNIETDEEIICIADVGRWNGTFKGYRETGWTNISQCLSFERDCYYATFYVDGYGNLRSRQSHHDGTHNILYREWKPGVSERQKHLLLERIYTGRVRPEHITKVTRSLGKRVKEVYGW